MAPPKAGGVSGVSNTDFRKTWDREEYADKAKERQKRVSTSCSLSLLGQLLLNCCKTNTNSHRQISVVAGRRWRRLCDGRTQKKTPWYVVIFEYLPQFLLTFPFIAPN